MQIVERGGSCVARCGFFSHLLVSRPAPGVRASVPLGFFCAAYHLRSLVGSSSSSSLLSQQAQRHPRTYLWMSSSVLGRALPRLLAPWRTCSNYSMVTQLSDVTHCRDMSTAYDVGNSTNIKWHETAVSTEDKERLLNQKGCVLWFTGLSGSGKSTVACTLEYALAERGHATALLDGDNIRHGLNKNLGFSAEDRQENIRRIGEVSKLFADAGIITLVSFISPYRKDRDSVRARLPPGRFVEIYMKVRAAGVITAPVQGADTSAHPVAHAGQRSVQSCVRCSALCQRSTQSPAGHVLQGMSGRPHAATGQDVSSKCLICTGPAGSVQPRGACCVASSCVCAGAYRDL